MYIGNIILLELECREFYGFVKNEYDINIHLVMKTNLFDIR